MEPECDPIKGTVLKADEGLPLNLQTIPELRAEIARRGAEWKRIQEASARVDAAIGLQRIRERAIKAAGKLIDS